MTIRELRLITAGADPKMEVVLKIKHIGAFRLRCVEIGGDFFPSTGADIAVKVVALGDVPGPTENPVYD